MELFTFTAFAGIITKAAKDDHNEHIVDGIAKLGPAYSIAEDPKNDSLDSVNVIMKLEEGLQNAGLKHHEIDDATAEQAKNTGDLYRLMCEKNGITPELDWTAPAAAAA